MTSEQRAMLEQVKRDCTEIGLQTYGRAPGDMKQTADWEKLQMAERMVRDMRAKLEKVLA